MPTPSELWLPHRKLCPAIVSQFRARLIVFPYAGATATTMNTIAQSAAPWLDVWCVQPPGKEPMLKEAQLDDCREVASQFADAVASELAQSTLPVALFGHSAGSWIMWEFMKQLDARGLRKPANVFVSTFPAPTIPAADVPWRKSRGLTDIEFQTELLKWECDKRMFRPRLWAKYADFMRTDCRLYDEYERKEHQWRWGDMPPCQLVYAQHDLLVTRVHVEMWRALMPHGNGQSTNAVADSPVSILEFDAGHGFLLNKQHAADMMEHISKTMRQPRAFADSSGYSVDRAFADSCVWGV